ncbi:hypothetical protein B0O80DRAFT_14882 [Mortierella sp. GBAus27b]|nr:hypothetical protein B0O80DRAFT_14882 [Mortierella sp. GBAus27b]
MCQRTICRDCGKFTWTGCGQHIAEVLAGLSLEEICSCDDDRDSEHSWATLRDPASTSQSITTHPIPQDASTGSSSSNTETSGTSIQRTVDPTGHCPDPPSLVEYRLSKISSTSAETAAARMTQQARALEELRKIKEDKERELKEANENALHRLLHGLSESEPGAD